MNKNKTIYQWRNVPYGLILFRLFLAPITLTIVYFGGEKYRLMVVIMMFLGLISDIFDGIIARKYNVSSTKLRRMDSQTDLIFWIAIAISCYWLNKEIILYEKWGVLIVFAMEGLCYLISFIKFRRETCTHAFLSKIWGLFLFGAFVSLIGVGHGGILLKLAIYWGVFSQIDVILIILLLPKWQNDIPSCYHAYLIRKGIPFRKNKFLND